MIIQLLMLFMVSQGGLLFLMGWHQLPMKWMAFAVYEDACDVGNLRSVVFPLQEKLCPNGFLRDVEKIDILRHLCRSSWG